ncbi:uncharacterized protein LOC100374334 [Saccoglossus kowalevskii]|uniref:Uncharacterized protein LOC100374334 n=1 Tax=Saccoglossus kowalevskii TaxID=10224 RepID=A0ABM0GWG0_SACKO|nr:PREDICTED: uncharacterized protein LOC100374334 [Saccoglossus kowalevskii]
MASCSVTGLIACLVVLGCLVNDVTPLQCTTCEYDEAWDWLAASSDYACVTDPASMNTESCDTTCYTWGLYTDDLSNAYNLKMKRGCASAEENSTWAMDDCDTYDDVSDSNSAFVCTCSDEDSCNADDSGYHKCYKCETGFLEDDDDYNCRSNLEAHYEPTPCLTGHSGCGTKQLYYNSWLFQDDTKRYCTDDTTTDSCTTDSNGYETCIYYCGGDSCNNGGSGANNVIVSTTLILALALVANLSLRFW